MCTGMRLGWSPLPAQRFPLPSYSPLRPTNPKSLPKIRKFDNTAVEPLATEPFFLVHSRVEPLTIQGLPHRYTFPRPFLAQALSPSLPPTHLPRRDRSSPWPPNQQACRQIRMLRMRTSQTTTMTPQYPKTVSGRNCRSQRRHSQQRRPQRARPRSRRNSRAPRTSWHSSWKLPTPPRTSTSRPCRSSANA